MRKRCMDSTKHEKTYDYGPTKDKIAIYLAE